LRCPSSRQRRALVVALGFGSLSPGRTLVSCPPPPLFERGFLGRVFGGVVPPRFLELSEPLSPLFRTRAIRVQLERLLLLIDSFGITTQHCIGERQVEMSNGIVGRQRGNSRETPARFAPVARSTTQQRRVGQRFYGI